MVHIEYIMKINNEISKPVISQNILYVFSTIGFVVVIIGGILLAVYTSRFIPSVFTSFETATVYMSNIISHKTPNKLVIVPQDIRINFGNTASSTVATTTKTAQKNDTSDTKKATATKTNKIHKTSWSANNTISNQIYSNGAKNKKIIQHYYGLPDLAVTMTAYGYLNGTSTSSFVASAVIPAHMQVAVKFRVTNKGTNVTGPWHLTIHIPTEINSVYLSGTLQSLLPGQPEDFIVHFTRAIPGANKKITVNVDPDNTIKESDENNNTFSINVTVLGS